MAEKACVLDTSIVVKWYTQESDSEDALELLKHITTNNTFILVPDLILYELANSLRWNSRFTDKDVQDALIAFVSLGFHVQPPSLDLLLKATSLAYSNTCAVYDATFLALAQENTCPLITADIKFAKAAQSKTVLTMQEFLNKLASQ